MPVPQWVKAPFLPEQFFHIVCKCHDGLHLFHSDTDRKVFIKRFYRFMGGFAELWSFILLNNHTHHICRIRPGDSIKNFIENLPEEDLTVSMKQWINEQCDNLLFDQMIERQMNRFLVSYVKYYNLHYQRAGSLFRRPFRRIQINNETHLKQAIIYVHANAIKHGIDNSYLTYPYSSYPLILNESGCVQSCDVLNFFGGRVQYENVHHQQVDWFYKRGWPSSKLE